MKRFDKRTLRRLRNDISIQNVIEELLQLPSKKVEGVYRFLCPVCNEFQTAINKSSNLARCFLCKRNFNPIDLVSVEKELGFVQSVNLLLQKEPLLIGALPVQQVLSRGVHVELLDMIPQLSYLLNNPCDDD